MARCKDLGRIADASYYSRRAQANGRCHLAKGHYRHAQFRSGADAARQALSGWGRGAHRATDRRERSESCRCRCLGSAAALAEFYASGKHQLLDHYSETCLRRVWLVQRFSLWMTSLLHRIPGNDQFEERRQLADLDYLTSSLAAAQSFAENYVGLPMS